MYETVEQKPVTGLIKFLQANVKYPTEAIEKDIQGRVFVQFIVIKYGSISSPAVIKSVNPLLDAEASRWSMVLWMRPFFFHFSSAMNDFVCLYYCFSFGNLYISPLKLT